MGEGDRASKYTVMNKALCEYVRLSFISNLFLHKPVQKNKFSEERQADNELTIMKDL